MVNKPLISPYFWGGTLGGGRLTSHDNMSPFFKGPFEKEQFHLPTIEFPGNMFIFGGVDKGHPPKLPYICIV